MSSYLLQSKIESCSLAWAWLRVCTLCNIELWKAGTQGKQALLPHAQCVRAWHQAAYSILLQCAVGVEKHVGVCQVKVTMVVGSPIEVPKVEQPSKEQVQQYLDCFIAEMKVLFEKHKASAGYPELQLTII